MKQEDKELLLKDLCVRVPYGVKVLYDNKVFDIEYVSPMYEEVKLDTPDNWTVAVSDIKPYLFPLSSMNDEEQRTLDSMCNDVEMVSRLSGLKMFDKAFDWLNENHFDYRGLIEKGIAIDATGLNIY